MYTEATSVVAITMRDGQPTVVLVTCVGQFSQLSVYQDDPDARPVSTNGVLVSWGVQGKAATEIIEVAVFGQPPDGWETEGEEQFGDPTEPGSFRSTRSGSWLPACATPTVATRGCTAFPSISRRRSLTNLRMGRY